MSLSKAQANEIHREVHAALKAIAEKHGMAVIQARANFTDTDMKFTTMMKLEGEKSRKEIQGEKSLGFYLAMYKLNETNARGDRLIAYNSRQYKYPFIYVTKEGKRFKCDLDSATLRFGQKQEA
jgi:hypothetical protein